MKKVLLSILIIAGLMASSAVFAENGKSSSQFVKTSQGSDVEERLSELENRVLNLQTPKDAPKDNVGSKFPVKLYGFIALQTFWGDAWTQLYTNRNNGQNHSFVAQSSVDDKSLVGIPNGDKWIGFTPQNSRIGLNWTGTKLAKDLLIGGKLEIDFLNPSGGMSPQPRMRLFYINFGGKSWMLRAGQAWDIFSPLNTRTLSLAGNLWFQGNLGFRRPQIRFTYNKDVSNKDHLTGMISVNNPSNLDTLINSGNTSSVPYFEGLFQYARDMKYGDLIVAVSGVFGQKRNAGVWDNVWGIAGSLVVPVHKFLNFSGEFQYGDNLGDFLTYAGNTRNAMSTDAWAQISSYWTNWFETNIGYGIDNVDKNRVTPTNTGLNTMIDSIYRNQNIFANMKFFPAKPFYIGVEYNRMRTSYRGNGTSCADIVMMNMVYTY